MERKPNEPKLDREEVTVMALVRRLRGVSFEWREDAPGGRAGQDLGVIAQEVEHVFPELVHTDASGYKSVNYAGLIAPLIEAIKELDARVDALEQAAHSHAHRTPAITTGPDATANST